MSQPISDCLLIKASVDDAAYEELIRRWLYNKKFGGMTHYGCPHDPHCSSKTTKEKMEALDARLSAEPRLKQNYRQDAGSTLR